MVPSKAEKTLVRMRNSQSGWRRTKIDSVYEGFGFIITSGANHDIVVHPDFPQLRATLTRSSGALHRAYVQYLIKLVDKLGELQDQKTRGIKNG